MFEKENYMTCAITTSFLGCLVTGFLFFRYTMFVDFALWKKVLLSALFMLMGCIPLLVSYQMQPVLGTAYPYYRYALYFVYIGCVILLTVTLVSDVLMLFVKSEKYACCSWQNALNLIIALLFTSWALHAGTKVPDVKTVAIASDKIKNEQTIAVLSDIHIHRTISADKVKQIVERTNAQNPDVILLAGDIIDDETVLVSDITALLKNLKAKNGIYFVTGNHEFYAGYSQTVDELKKLGFIFLENSGVSANNELYVAGIPDLFSSAGYGIYTDMKKTFAAAKNGQYRLLMSHTPGDFVQDEKFDLEVSGHTHGGQIFPFHIFAKLHNKYLAGLYNMDNQKQIYVSRGAGQWGPQMRFLAPSEITIIKLTPKHEEN